MLYALLVIALIVFIKVRHHPIKREKAIDTAHSPYVLRCQSAPCATARIEAESRKTDSPHSPGIKRWVK